MFNIKSYEGYSMFPKINKSITTILFLICITILIQTGCSGGGGSSSNYDSQTKIDLAKESNLTDLYFQIKKITEKDEYETEVEYNTRLQEYANKLTGYYSTLTLNTHYDAETKQLYIQTLPINYSDCPALYGYQEIVLYDGCTHFMVSNTETLPIIQNVLTLDADTAKRIADGFRVDYEYRFTVEDLKRAKNTCASAWFTNCSNNLSANVEEVRVYNVIDGNEYY